MDRRPIKRTPELITLSSDHHSLLLLAFQCKQAVGGRRLAGAGRDLEEQAQRALSQREAIAAHFRAEEEVLAPLYLRHVGEGDPDLHRFLVDHLTIHRLLFDLSGAGGGGLREALRELSARLEEHIRFEERVLFGKVEAALTAEERQLLKALLPERAALEGCAVPP